MRSFRPLLLLFFLALWGCRSNTDTTRSKPLIVATTSILADGIQQLVGDQAEVVSLMPPGVDPHLYKASVRDLDLHTQADQVVY